MTTRRGFLLGMLALGAAPAIVRASSLMSVVTPSGLWIGYDLSTGPDQTCILTGVPDELTYYAIMHPSMEQMVREMLVTGTGYAHIMYRSEVIRHG